MITTVSVTSIQPINSIQQIGERIAPLRARLAAHPLYTSIRSANDIRTFMEYHVFAVWDFMCLLKALQRKLTCIEVPWHPTEWPASRRFLNEIVLGEESDQFEGRFISHFELYLEAMEECGADTGRIRDLLAQLAMAGDGATIAEMMASARVPGAARRFVQSTFDIVQSENLGGMAAAFTFGREDLIPAMFRLLIRDLNNSGQAKLSKFNWYLERHIEIDGEDHGPLSLKMVMDLCGRDEQAWEIAAHSAEISIIARIELWDGILKSLGAWR